MNIQSKQLGPLGNFRTFAFSLLALLASILVQGVESARANDVDLMNGRAEHAGVGIILGQPSGLVGKYWLEKNRAVDAGFGYSFETYAVLYSDYLFHFPGALGPKAEYFVPYVGAGGEIIFWSGAGTTRGVFVSGSGGLGLALRVPAGVEYLVPNAPVGIFAELVPMLLLVPGTTGVLQGGVGARVYL